MSNTNETLKKSFMDRYTKLKLFEEFLLNEIKILEALPNSSTTDSTEQVQKAMSELSRRATSDEVFCEAKQIAQSFLNNESSYNIALARLNYLYDITCFKASHMWLIQDTFKCYF